MKKLLLFVCATLLSFTGLRAQEENVGVNFEHGTLNEAIAKAKAENKMVFLDCYTSWCGPCKYMSTKVFTTKEAGDFFNKNFVNIKIDMEKGEGPELAKKFGVRAFPTFMVFDNNGEEQHRIVGGGEVAEFIKSVEKGMNPETSMKGMADKYAKGDRNPEMLKSYIAVLLDTYKNDDATKIVTDLLASLKDNQKQSKEYWWIYSNQDLAGYGSENFNYLLANRKGFSKANTEAVVNETINKVMLETIAFHLSGNAVRKTKGDVNAAKAEFTTLTKFIADNKIKDASIEGIVKMTNNKYTMEPMDYLNSCKTIFPTLKGEAYLIAFDTFNRNVKVDRTKELYQMFIDIANNGLSNVSDPRHSDYLKKVAARYTEEMSKL